MPTTNIKRYQADGSVAISYQVSWGSANDYFKWISFTDTNEISLIYNDLSPKVFKFDDQDANPQSDLRFDFKFIAQNQTNSENWSQFNLDIVGDQFYNDPSSATRGHPGFAHFHSTASDGKLPSLPPFDTVKGYVASDEQNGLEPGPQDSLKGIGADRLYYSNFNNPVGPFSSTGASEAIKVHHWEGDFYVIFSPLALYTDKRAFTNFGPTYQYDSVWQGGDGAETQWGTNANDVLDGLGGKDVLVGSSGDDTLIGGDGDDSLLGGMGYDWLFGGSGNDELSASDHGDSDGSWMEGGDGNDFLGGSDGQDSLRGGAGDDSLVGGSEADYLAGGADNDNLIGGSGADTITGGAGIDHLSGGAGNDTLHGDQGDDYLYGDGDVDSFFYYIASNPPAGNGAMVTGLDGNDIIGHASWNGGFSLRDGDKLILYDVSGSQGLSSAAELDATNEVSITEGMYTESGPNMTSSSTFMQTISFAGGGSIGLVGIGGIANLSIDSLVDINTLAGYEAIQVFWI